MFKLINLVSERRREQVEIDSLVAAREILGRVAERELVKIVPVTESYDNEEVDVYELVQPPDKATGDSGARIYYFPNQNSGNGQAS